MNEHLYEPTDAELMADAIGNAWASGLTIDELTEALIIDGQELTAQQFNAAIWATAKLAHITARKG